MPSRRIEGLVWTAILVLAAALTLYPVVWMLAASFKSNTEMFSTPLWQVGTAGGSNYVVAFQQRPFFLYLFNSVLVSLISVGITLAFSLSAAFGFAKYRFPANGLLWILVLAAMMIPLEAIVIPLFLEVHAFGWTDSYAGLALPTALNVIGMFMLRQAILDVPDDFIDAARIDGASEPRILINVVAPMIGPSLVAVAVLTFTLTWNGYLWPLIAVSDDSLRTLPLGMAAFQNSLNTQYGQVMAVSVFGSIPTVAFFIAFQRYFIESAVASGIK